MKLPFDLSLKFVFRALLPGLAAGLALLPLMEAALIRANAQVHVLIVFASLVLICGWLVMLMDMPVYMLYEGRRYWPERLRQSGLKREQARLQRLLAVDERYRKGEAGVSYRALVEAWFDIRRFPLDENGRPAAEFPTRLGNLLAAFEGYPDRRYNLDGVFYWPRLWVRLDKDLREELDSSQAVADSAIYTSFTLYFLGVMYLLYAGYRALGLTGLAGVDTQPVLVLVLIAAAGFLGGFLLYRLGLHAQASYGERFKATFDQNLAKVNFPNVVKLVAELTGQPGLTQAPLQDRRQAAWVYLQYYRVVPPGETRSIPVPEYLERLRQAEGQAGTPASPPAPPVEPAEPGASDGAPPASGAQE